MKPQIYLALTHDWELRGDGSGDIEQIQFAPMRRLMEIYERHGVRVTFFPELMQQLSFRRYETNHLELKSLADSWDEHVRNAFEAGHDMQLHIHSRWQGVRRCLPHRSNLAAAMITTPDLTQATPQSKWLTKKLSNQLCEESILCRIRAVSIIR